MISAISEQGSKALYSSRVISLLASDLTEKCHSQIVLAIFVPHFIYMALITAYLTTFLAQRPDSELLRTEQLTVGGLTLMALLYLVVKEYQQAQYQKDYWQSAFNWIDCAQFVLNFYVVLASAILGADLWAVGQGEAAPPGSIEAQWWYHTNFYKLSTLRAIGAVSTTLLWLKVFEIMRLYKSTAFYYALLKQTVVDLSSYFKIWLAVLATFATALFLLGVDSSAVVRVTGLWPVDAIFTEYMLVLGQVSADELGSSFLVSLLVVVVTLSCTVLLLNMIIAIVCNSFAKVRDNYEAYSTMGKLEIIADYSFIFLQNSDLLGTEKRFVFVVTPLDVEAPVDSWSTAAAEAPQSLAAVESLRETVKAELAAQSELIKCVLARTSEVEKACKSEFSEVKRTLERLTAQAE